MGLVPWRTKQPESRVQETSPLGTLRSEIDRLFDTFVREPVSSFEWPFGGGRGWSPAVDIAETDEEVLVRAELPGMDPGEIDITVCGGQLVLSGEKRESTEQSGKGFYHTESRYGTFRRALPLPEAVDPDKVEAEYANGVLTVHLKKSPAAAAKRIQVKAKE
jgi:HSP20 family protein